jgi:cytokinesis protein
MAPDLCTENFLSELKGVLPSPEQIGKLNVYRNADPEEIAGLHPSDRLMVELIKIDRLSPRLQGMLFKARFDEQISLWEENARKLSEAGEALLHATKFKELMSVCASVLHIIGY